MTVIISAFFTLFFAVLFFYACFVLGKLSAFAFFWVEGEKKLGYIYLPVEMGDYDDDDE